MMQLNSCNDLFNSPLGSLKVNNASASASSDNLSQSSHSSSPGLPSPLNNVYQQEKLSQVQNLMGQLSLAGSNVNTSVMNGSAMVPSRELFLVNADVNQKDLLALLQQCGEVSDLNRPTDAQHIWYVSYYDIRAAQRAQSTFQGKSIDGIQAPLEIHTKSPWTDGEGLGEDCLIVSYLDPSTPAASVYSIFQGFGDIMDAKVLPNNRRAIQFFDVRSAQAAFNQLANSGVVTVPSPHNSANISPCASALNLGSLPMTASAGLLGGAPVMASGQMDVNQQVANFAPASLPLAQLGMMQTNNSASIASQGLMPSGASVPDLSAIAANPASNLAALAFPQVASAPNLVAMAMPQLGFGFPNLMQPQNEMAQMMAAVQAQALINAAQGILQSANLGGLDITKLAQHQAEIARKAEMAKKYALDLEKIQAGEDKRTTLMLKNIPNKYSPQMLLDTINQAGLEGHYDFLYLPIDFRNRCNVGYAFINMRDPVVGVPLMHKEFDGRRWERFNSEKVTQISYARIQGREQLIQHFQNSSLMLEDESYRPMLFNDQGEMEEFPVGPDVQPRIAKVGSNEADSLKGNSSNNSTYQN
eukprot:TRINITY_DN2536_c0_g1_i2.p1 TRINITY_DN2536_c0_g1~~TRINITY_DN2536_c0_g1_i2.p1  ORF type:complete len:586 (+),score=82.27 TRINITY_DN2536_c0_g1_i2:139-1896(+)